MWSRFLAWLRRLITTTKSEQQERGKTNNQFSHTHVPFWHVFASVSLSKQKRDSSTGYCFHKAITFLPGPQGKCLFEKTVKSVQASWRNTVWA